MRLAIPAIRLTPATTFVLPAPRLSFVLALPIYLLIHLALRLLEGSTLRWDESEQTLFSQRLALGYNDQPPVYTWLLWCVFRLTGATLAGLYSFKLAVLAGCYLGGYAFARRLTDHKHALLASLALLVTPYFAWSVLIDGAHTLFVAAFVPVAFWLLLRIADRPSSFGFASLGFVLGLGVLAKYSFVMLAAAFPLAMLSLPDYRNRLKDWRIVWMLIVAAIVLLPHGWWVRDNWQLIRERPMVRSGMLTPDGRQDAFGAGLISLLRTTILSIGSLAAVLLAVYPRSAWRLFTTSSKSDSIRLLGRWLAIVAVMLIVLALIGVSRFRTHWLIPVVILLPVYVFARFAEMPEEKHARRRFVSLAGLAVLAAIGFRSVGIVAENKPQHQGAMHDAVVRDLQAKGFISGTIVGDHPIICGNLRKAFPDAQIICTYYPAFARLETRPSFIVWDASQMDEPMPRLQEFLEANAIGGRSSEARRFESQRGGNGLRRIGVMAAE